MQSLSLFDWNHAGIELAGFLGAFLAAGAIGFHFAIANRVRRVAPIEDAAILERASRRAATLGLIGALIVMIAFAAGLPAAAARRHATIGSFVIEPMIATQIALGLVTAVGFACAIARRAYGWPLAALGVVVGSLRAALFGQWSRLVNPMHQLAAELWLGTLFVMIFAGFSTVMSGAISSDRRGAIAARMVHAFSPLALCAAAVLAVFGTLSAWRHLDGLASLWTTPWGVTFLIKLGLVSLVVALGAWNWRRARPRLGSERAAIALTRTARAELLVTAVVLVITALLVSVPPPRPQ